MALTITKQLDLTDFKFFAGSKDFADLLTKEELNTIQTELESQYPDGISENNLINLFWFRQEYLSSLIGLESSEIWKRNNNY